MSERNTRIRWTEQERDTVRRAFQALRAKAPTRGVADLFVAAQKELPPRRRRQLNHKLRAWLDGDRQAPPANEVAATMPVRRGARAKGPHEPKKPGKSTVLVASMPVIKTSPQQHARIPAQLPSSAAMAKIFAEFGSDIVADILSSARVRKALRELLQSVLPMAASEAQAAQSNGPDSAQALPAHAVPDVGAVPVPRSAKGKLRVLIAGMPQAEGRVLARTYDDTLELRSWSAEDGVQLLPDAVQGADVVVGMATVLSQPVEQTLRRHAKRYLRNARGVAGLRSELAGLALSGDGLATPEA